MSKNIQNISLFLSESQQCNYLEEQQSRSLFIDPTTAPDKNTYSSLIKLGFRRSGHNVYKPHCEKCQQCLSTRVNVNLFTPNKSQKRCLQKNQDINTITKPALFEEEHYILYTQYLNERHANSGMDGSSKSDYINFLTSSWSKTKFVEFRLNKKLLALAVTDFVDDGLSAVYTFFATEKANQKRSLGVNAILWQIAECKRLGYNWLYLGYWVAGNKKMSYKNQYQPAEHYINGKWMQLI